MITRAYSLVLALFLLSNLWTVAPSFAADETYVRQTYIYALSPRAKATAACDAGDVLERAACDGANVMESDLGADLFGHLDFPVRRPHAVWLNSPVTRTLEGRAQVECQPRLVAAEQVLRLGAVAYCRRH